MSQEALEAAVAELNGESTPVDAPIHADPPAERGEKTIQETRDAEPAKKQHTDAELVDMLVEAEEARNPKAGDYLTDTAEEEAETFQQITEDLAKQQQLSPEQSEYLQSQAQQALFQKMQLDQEFNAIDWPRLQRENPGLAAQTQLHFQGMYGQLQDNYAGLFDSIQAHQKQAQHAFEQQQKQNEATLKRMIPEWQEEAVALREKTMVKKYAKNHYGFSHEELDSIQDPRHFKVLRDLMLKDQKLSKSVPKAQMRKRSKPSRPKLDPNKRYTDAELVDYLAGSR